MYYQMSMKQRELTVINVPNSHILSLKSIYFCGILYPSIEILDKMFHSASNLLQDPASLVQCIGSIKLNKNDSFTCYTNCAKFKSYKICSHTIAVAEKQVS